MQSLVCQDDSDMNIDTIEKCGKFVRAVLSCSCFFILEKDEELNIVVHDLGTPHHKEW